MKNKPFVSNNYFATGHLKTNLKKKAISGAAFIIGSQLFVNLIQLSGAIILARILSPEDFGLVAMVTAFSALFIMFRRLGLTDATVQKEDVTHSQVSALFWLNFFFCLGLTLIFIAISPLISIFYNDPRLKSIAIVSSFGFIIGGLSTQHIAILRRNFKFNLSALNEVLSTLLAITISIFLAIKGMGYWAVVAKPLLLATFMTVGSWYFCRWRPGPFKMVSGVIPMLKFGLNVLGTNTVNYLSMNLDKILIGLNFGPTSLGFYHKAFHLFLAPAQQTTYPLTSVAVATLSRLVDEPIRFKQFYLNAVSMLMFFGFPLSALLTLLSKDIILFLLGPQWEPAASVFSAFGFGIGIQILYASNSWIHLSLGRADRWFRWGLFAAALLTISFIIGLPFGPVGVALSYTLCMHLLVCLSLQYAGKPIGFGFLDVIKTLWRFYFSAVASGLLYWYLASINPIISIQIASLNHFLKIIMGISIYSISYLLIIIVLYQGFSPFILTKSMLTEFLHKRNTTK